MSIVADSPPPVLGELTPAARLAGAEHRFLLHGVSWETYSSLRAEQGSGVRMTFDRGDLEIMTLGLPHENVSRMIAVLINVWAEEREVLLRQAGSLTLSRRDRSRGLEGDASFYICNYSAMHGREQFDIARDPPPDLVVEVQFSTPALDKLPIYAALGVPEVWLWQENAFTILILSPAGVYETAADSLNLPGFPVADSATLLAQFATVSGGEMAKAFRQTVRELP